MAIALIVHEHYAVCMEVLCCVYTSYYITMYIQIVEVKSVKNLRHVASLAKQRKHIYVHNV